MSDPIPETSSPSQPAAAPPAAPSSKSSPAEVLPTDRVSFENQLKLLQGYAAASNGGTRPVGNEEVAKLVDITASTTSLANSFFTKLGFLQRSGREFIPAKEVLEYKLAHQWNPETAAEKLLPIISRAWFAEAINAKLQMRPMSEGEVVSALAQRAGVTPAQKQQVLTLINYMVATGYVRREGDQIVLNRVNPETQKIEEKSQSAVVDSTKVRDAVPVAGDMEVHKVKLNGVVVAELHLSLDLKQSKDINAVWTKLDKLKAWVIAQLDDSPGGADG